VLKLAASAKLFDHMARGEGLWRRHFEARTWRLTPMKVPGSVLARRWEEFAGVEELSVYLLKKGNYSRIVSRSLV